MIMVNALLLNGEVMPGGTTKLSSPGPRPQYCQTDQQIITSSCPSMDNKSPTMDDHDWLAQEKKNLTHTVDLPLTAK